MRRPPAGPAQRVTALLTVGVLTVAIAALAMRPGPPARAPAALIQLAFPQLELPDARTSGSLPTVRSSSSDFIVLYVSDECPHCTRELARWDSILSSDRRWFGTQVTVIRARGADRTRQLAAFAHRELVDAHGDVARALRIHAVPASFVVSRDGTITDRRVGQAGPRAIQRFLAKVIQ